MKTKTYLVVMTSSALFASSLLLSAQTPTPAASPGSSPGKQSTRPIPFHGMISSVDQTNKTFTISGKETTRVFKVTDKTTITKGGAAATMNDIAANEEVSGSYWKNPDGTLEAKTVKIGPAKKKATSPSSKASASPGS